MLRKGGERLVGCLHLVSAIFKFYHKQLFLKGVLRMNTFKKKGFTLVELMVVIVIIGILAAVAIPKFMDASQKAKASEFPTNLTAMYTGEMAYQAENGTYTSTMSTLKNVGGVEVADSSKFFTYSLDGTDSAFTGKATVKSGFGKAAKGEWASINQANAKAFSATDAGLAGYVPSWK
jgi:type IV pilus assembly protein PilA